MRNALSWFLSLFLHFAAVLLLMHSIQLEPLFPEKLLEVDLTEITEPDPIVPLPAPDPIVKPPPPEEAVAESAKDLPAPPGLPMDKTVVLDDTPQPPPEAPSEPEPTPEAEPPDEPGAIAISPVKTLPPEEREHEDGTAKIIDVRKDFIVHRGHEARFGRSMMGDYFSYSAKEFSGHFRTKDNRTISIIDARETKYGRFLIYDSKNKTLRRLKRALGKYVYTIGPSLYADEPVQGSVTFLAKNDHIERFILMTDDDRIAHYPCKVHVREEDTAFRGPAGDIAALLTRPPSGSGHPGVVIVHGTACTSQGLVQGFTRSLSMFNLATLSFQPRGCSGDTLQPTGEADLVADTVAARSHMAGLAPFNKTKVGIWGNGQGVPAAIKAAKQASAPYLVCMVTDSLAPDAIPEEQTLAALDMPVLWFVTSRNAARWRPLVAMLETLRNKQKKPFTVIVAPLKTSKEVLSAKSDQSGWVDQVADNHASLAVSWISNLKP